MKFGGDHSKRELEEVENMLTAASFSQVGRSASIRGRAVVDMLCIKLK